MMVLNGSPWTQNSSFSLHARSMLNVLLKETSKYEEDSILVFMYIVHMFLLRLNYPIDSVVFFIQNILILSVDMDGIP